MMIATTELCKIFKTGHIDNSQVSCIADALVEYVGEPFAGKFVNKCLEDSEIAGVKTFPKMFAREKFVEVNNLWKRQGWVAKHRLADGKPVAASSMSAESALRVAQRENVELRAKLESEKVRLDDAARFAAELKAEKAKAEERLSVFSAVFPDEVAILGEKFSKALSTDVGSRRVIYLYLAMISAESVERSPFGYRFKLFDDELYLLLKKDPKKLKQCREMFAEDLNPRLASLRVTWDLVGETFDETKFTTTDSSGTVVAEVISAMITKINGDIARRAKVRLENTES